MADRAQDMNGVATMADVIEIERRRPSLPNSTYEMIEAAAAVHGDAPALSFFMRVQDHERPTTWTYRSFLARITATANFFRSLGVTQHDVIAFVLPNLPETHLTIWGGEAAGIVFAINPMLEPTAIAGLLRAGEAKVLVTLAPFPGMNLWSKLQPILGEAPGLRHLVLVNPAHHFPSAERPALIASQQLEEKRLCGEGGVPAVSGRLAVHDFTESIGRQHTNTLISGRVIRPADPSSFFCTGGTTGLPKIAMRTHANEVANAWSVGQVFGNGVTTSKTLFCGLPLFHVNAALVTGLLPFSRGAHVLLGTPDGYRGEGVVPRFWELVERHKINFFSGVPTVYAALLQQPTQGRDLRSLEYGLCGAAPMPAELMRNFQETTGLKLLEGYGLTEGACVSTCNPPGGERRIGSIGLRMPLQPMKAVVLDDSGAYVRDCTRDEVGVLVIRGPNVFAGYKTPEHNRDVWVDAGDDARWLNTGDLGRQDKDGYFYLTGRRKELIIRGGHNIDPASIEEPLHQHPAVQIVAAVGRPDAHAGEVPVAYVQLKPGARATEAELMTFIERRIGERAALPKAVRIVESIPLTGVGKIFKPDLKRREIALALVDALRDAGVNCSSVIVCSEPNQQVMLRVSLCAHSDPDLARRVLGKFPFSFELDQRAR
jgi:fatty-acyl-CoA synthase